MKQDSHVLGFTPCLRSQAFPWTIASRTIGSACNYRVRLVEEEEGEGINVIDWTRVSVAKRRLF